MDFTSMIYDFCVVGGGIVGLATARELLRAHAGASLLILEKEVAPATHQTGHNSGVIHAGIYYAPGSLKARLCREGAAAIKSFCNEHGIPWEKRGKLIVATDAQELEGLERLARNAADNDIHVERIDAAELRRREPMISGIGALFVADTGIVDYRQVCRAMERELRTAGAVLVFDVEVDHLAETADVVSIGNGNLHWQARQLVVCGGLQSDRLARMAGLAINHQIIPFRGEYYELRPGKPFAHHLIYPVPTPDLPFLGIHLTPMIDGRLTVGPNAVLGLAREVYGRFGFHWRDCRSYLGFAGFWRMLRSQWRFGLTEALNSLSKARYLAACRKYCPSLTLSDLVRPHAGIRAQAVMSDGTLVHDFLFLETPRMLHVCNAPSPAATSSIPIGRMIAERLTHNSAR